MSANIYELISQRQLAAQDWQDRKIFGYTHGHGSLVERLGFKSQLEGHRGCVNCLEWNSTGSLLVSGSDDLSAIVWDPHRNRAVATMPTGHTGNIFSVKFMPFSGDGLLLTGAEDKEVRLHDLNTFETTQVWSCNQSRVKRLATSRHSPFLFWSAGEDGCVRQHDIREPHSCEDKGCRNVLIDFKLSCGSSNGNTQCKCIDINPVRSEQIAVGALDAYVRIYDKRILSLKYSARDLVEGTDPACLGHFAPGHISNPRTQQTKRGYTALATTFVTFSPDGSELLVNLSGEHVYLYDVVRFRRALRYNIMLYSASKPPHLEEPIRTYDSHSVDIHKLTTNPFYDGRHFPLPSESVEESTLSERVKEVKEEGNKLYKKGKFTAAIQKYSEAIFLCPTWHILYSNRATALYGRKWEGDIYAALKDAEVAINLCPTNKKALQRRMRCMQFLGWFDEGRRFLHFYKEKYPEDREEFFGKFNMEFERAATEAEILPLLRRNGYRDQRTLTNWEAHSQWNAYDYKVRFCGHCNTHTDIKEASFLGDQGEYIAAGSDDGNIFIWEKVTGNLVRILRGDDSIVNCVQWHPGGPLLASSGIESVVRLWEPKPIGYKEDRLVEDIFKAGKENQRRMKIDPFEIMLMRMGFHIAGPERTNRRPRERDDEAAPAWIEDPGACRQS